MSLMAYAERERDELLDDMGGKPKMSIITCHCSARGGRELNKAEREISRELLYDSLENTSVTAEEWELASRASRNIPGAPTLHPINTISTISCNNPNNRE